MDKTLILNRLKKINNFSTDIDLANFLGISKSTLSNWYKRNSIDYDLVFSKCEQRVNRDWLLTGRGNMFNEQSSDIYTTQIMFDNTFHEHVKLNKEERELFLESIELHKKINNLLEEKVKELESEIILLKKEVKELSKEDKAIKRKPYPVDDTYTNIAAEHKPELKKK